MSYLAAHLPLIQKASANFSTSAEAMRAIINSAEQQALSAQAFNRGEHAIAFQAAHTRFIESIEKVNQLLCQATEQMKYAGTTYSSTDNAMAHNIGETISP